MAGGWVWQAKGAHMDQREAQPVAAAEAETAADPRDVVIFSQRDRLHFIWHTAWFEFEDVVAEVEDAQILSTTAAEPYGFWYRARRRVGRDSALFRHVPSGHERRPIGRDVDLFACFVQHPDELVVLDAIPDWRERAKLKVCLIEEIWLTTLPILGRLYDVLSDFDVVAVSFPNTVGPLSERIGKPVIHIPCAVDMERFGSLRPAAERVIDLYYMGRRRPELHELLVDRFEAERLFYLYTAFAMPMKVSDHREHRRQLASMITRSKLFFVDYAKFNKQDETEGQMVWGPRYFEGMCGGAVAIGARPRSPDFEEYLGWPESVVALEDDPKAAVDQMVALIADPDVFEAMARVNVAQSLLRHDWAHRWAKLLAAVGLAPTGRMTERLASMQARSTAILP